MSVVRIYDINGNELDYDNYNLIGAGTRSQIFESKKENENDKQTILKVYESYLSRDLTINEQVFDELKDIDTYTLPKLGEKYYDTPKRKRFLRTVRGYTAEKIDKDYIDLLSADPEFVAEKVMGNLSVLAGELGNRKIKMDTDLESGDLIINKNGAFIVDIDLFEKKRNMTKDECTRMNKKLALYYLKSLVFEYAYHRHDLCDRSEQINELFSIDVTNNVDLTSSLYKKLRNKPIIDHLKK